MIIKFNPEGRVMMVFGRKKEASDERHRGPVETSQAAAPAINGQFRQPTDVTWDTQGNIFISDGYINSRVAKYDKNGDWVKQWGDSRQQAGRVQHAAQHRRRRARQHLRRRPRATGAFRCSIPTATFQREITIDVPRSAGRPSVDGQSIAAFARRDVGSAAPTEPCSRRALGHLHHARTDAVSLQRRRVSGAHLQADAGRQSGGHVRQTGRQPKQFGWIHEMACPSENELYAAEILNWRVQKLLLHPRRD